MATHDSSPTTLGELAELVGADLSGDPTRTITGAWPLDTAEPGCITLVDHVDRIGRLGDTPAVAAVAPIDAGEASIDTLRVADPHAAFATIVKHFRPPAGKPPAGIAPTAVVDLTATVAADASIGSHAVVGPGCVVASGAIIGAGVVLGENCRVGEDSFLAAGVVLYDRTVVGCRCRVHSNATLGADGFGYQQRDGKHVLVAQLGNVEIEDDVEIGAGACIDRGVYGPTRIGTGTKIDNLVQIGHNCQIGKHNLICSQVGIAGSTTTGDYVVMAGQVGIRDHVHIGEGATLSAMAGVSNSVAAGETVLGAPATPVRQQKLQMAAVAKLPQLRKEFRELRRQVDELLAQADAEAGQNPNADRAA